MTLAKYMILIAFSLYLYTSCTQKRAHPTGGFQDINVTRNNGTGFGDDPKSKVPDPMFLYLQGCYTGNVQGIESQFMTVYIDARNLDVDGWAKDTIRVALKGNFTNTFNITDNDCINFTNPVTSQAVEYFRDKYGNLGANISLELAGLGSGQIQPGIGTENCILYGKPIRLDLRLIFEIPEINYENGQIKKTQVIKIKNGSYILYYANIQRAYLRNGDKRSENPNFCCTLDSPDSEAWGTYLSSSEALCRPITLDKTEDLSYFLGVLPDTKEISLDPNCTSIVQNCV